MVALESYCFSQSKEDIQADSSVIQRKHASNILLTTESSVATTIKKDLSQSFFDSIRPVKSLISTTTHNIFDNPIRIVNLTTDYSGLLDTSYLYHRNQYVSNFTATTSWAIFSIPMSISYRNEWWSDVGSSRTGNFSFQYDRKNYLEQLRTTLNQKLKTKNFLQTITDPLLDAKRNAEKLLTDDFKQINEKYKNSLNDIIQEIGDPSELFEKEIPSIRQKFLGNDYIKSARDLENLYSQLLQKKNSGEQIDPIQFKTIEELLLKKKGTEDLVNKIEEHKKKWESSGLIKKMKEWNLFKMQNLQKVMQDPSTTIKAAKEYLNLNGLQRFFLKIDKLDMGRSAFSLSPLSIQHFLNNGIVTQFKNSKNSLMALVGKQGDYNSLLDMPFANNIISNAGSAKSIGFGTGVNSNSHSQVTLSSYSQTLSSINVPTALATFRRLLVTTLSNEINLGKNGSLSTEISKSSTNYAGDTAADNGLKKIISTDDFWKNTAFSIKYEDQYSKQNLSYQVYVRKTANGYNNPGNVFLNSGSAEMGFGIKKLFFQRRLQANLRGDLREYKYSDEKNDKWRSIYSVFDLRWKLKKGQFVGLRYMPNKMIRLDANTKSVINQLNRLSADASLARKISVVYYRNYLTLAYQKNAYQVANSWILTKTILISSSQTLTIGKSILYLNTNFNYANNQSQYIFFNSSFVSDVGSSYILFKKIGASSSITYNSITGWYQQIGIRQTVSSQIGQRFSMNLYVDARKNIRVYQPLLFGLVRADLSFHYQLK